MVTETVKILAQVNPTANILTDAYTVPAGKSTAVSTVVVCNRNLLSQIHFSITIAVAGATDDAKQYLYYLCEVAIQDTFAFTFGLSLSSGDVIRVLADDADVAFNIYGIELS